jgi:CHASE3 domain sensor protein
VNFSKQYFIDKKDAQLAYSFRRLFIRTIILTVLFLVAVYIINYNQKQALTTGQLLAHTKEVIFQSEKTISLVKDYETSARGFVISGNSDFLQPFINIKDSVKNSIGNLKQLVKDNSSQQASIDSLAGYIHKRFLVSDSSIRLRKESGLTPALQFVSTGMGKRYMDTIRMIESHIQQRENELLAKRALANGRAVIINRVTLVGCLLLFFIVLVILFWQAWFNLREYNNRHREVNIILGQLAKSLMNAQQIAHIGSWEWDVTANEEKWSDEMYRIFGYENTQVKITHALFENAVYLPDREMVRSTIANAIEKKIPYDIFFRVMQPNGTIRNVHALG